MVAALKAWGPFPEGVGIDFGGKSLQQAVVAVPAGWRLRK